MRSHARRFRVGVGLVVCAWAVLVGTTARAEPVDQATAENVAADQIARRYAAWQANLARRARQEGKAQAEAVAPAPPQNRQTTPLLDPQTGRILGYVIALDPVGYVVTSGDTNLMPVIAFSFESNFSFEECHQNILLRMVRTDLKRQLQACADAPADRLAGNQAMWAPPADGQVIVNGESEDGGGVQNMWGPWLDTRWSQGYYYNKYCPIDPLTGNRCVTGCVATAMAQVLNYWEYPRRKIFTHADDYVSVMDGDDGYGIRIIPIDATLASVDPLEYRGDPEDPNQPTHDMIGKLCHAAGVSVHMGYTSAQSAANSSWGVFVDKWDYNYNLSGSYSGAGLANQMKLGHVAYVEISPEVGEYGHAIVADGYWEANNPAGDPPVLYLYHFNFGWGGGTDGWYAQGGFPDVWLWGGGGDVPVPPAPDVLAMPDANVVLGVPYTGPAPQIDPDTQSRPVVWSLPDANNVNAGMTVGAQTGVISWPSPGALGSVHFVTLRGKNEAGEDQVTFKLTVVAPPPGPPVIDTIPDGQIGTGESYSGPKPVLLQGTLPVTWSLPDPNNTNAGMGINPATGRVTWAQARPSNSVHTITVMATNSVGTGTASWRLTVIPPPGPPLIGPMPDQTIPAGATSPYVSQKPPLERGTLPVVWDLPDPNNVAAGLHINWQTGVVDWAAPGPSNSVHTVRIRAQNNEGSYTRAFKLTVTIPIGEPLIDLIDDQTIPAGSATPYWGPEPVLLQGTLPVTWSLDPNSLAKGMAIDPNSGVVNWPAPGPAQTVHTVTITASNTVGTGSRSWDLTITLPLGPPVIEDIADDDIYAGPNYPYTGPTPILTRGTDPITWSFNDPNAMPAGMTIDPNTGVVSWPEPGPAGSVVTVTIRATNDEGSDTESWQLTVNEPPTPPVIAAIDNAEIPGGAGHPYQGPQPVVSGTPPMTWSLPDANNVSAGMTINTATGVVSWPVPGPIDSVHYVTIQATNDVGQDTETWMLTVIPPPVPPVIDEIADDSTPAGAPYTSPTPSLPGDTTLPVTWSLDPANQAVGMTIDANTGVVWWPAPGPADSVHTITIQALNSVGTDTESWQLTVTLPLGAPIIDALSDETIPGGPDYPYESDRPRLIQGTPPVTWSLPDANNTNAGMGIDSATGVVTWPSPGPIGSVHVVTLRAANGEGADTKTYQLTVTYPYGPPVVADMDDETILAGPNYPYQSPVPDLVQGTLPITWSLPDPNNSNAGMTINTATGQVSWAAPGPENSAHVVTIKAQNGPGETTVSWTLTVIPAPAAPSIGAMGDVTIYAGPNYPYVSPQPAVSGSGPITWSLPDPNNRDAGMTIGATTGVVRWSSPGPIGSVHIVTIKAVNSLGQDVESWTITVVPPPGVPIIDELSDATIPGGASHPYQRPAPGLLQGTLPVLWSLPDANNRAAGMTINQTTGVFGWVSPGPIGTVHTVSVQARNALGSDTAMFVLTVAPPLGEPVIGALADQMIPAGSSHPYESPAPSLLQGTLPVTWSLPDANNVGAGMSIDEDTGVVAWANPAAMGSPYFVTVMATNGVGQATRTYKLTVTGVPVIAPIPAQTATQGEVFYSDAPSLTSGQGATWSFANPAQVPSKMSMPDPNTGVIRWETPTLIGSPFTITLRATNVAGSDEQDMTINVVKPTVTPIIGPIADASVVKGQPYVGPTPLLLAGGPGTTWEFADTPPAGMTINETTGVVSWPSPADSGDVHTITIRAKNSAGQDEESWQLTVVAPKVAVTIAVVPGSAGMTVNVDGLSYIGSHTFTWDVDSSHDVSVDDVQTGSDGAVYVFKSWSDGNTSASRTLLVQQAASYTATMQKVVAANLTITGPAAVPENSSKQYTLELTMSNGDVVDATTDASWRLSSTSCASVDKGKVTAREVNKHTYCEVYATYTKDGANLSARLPITITNVLKTFTLTVQILPEGAAAAPASSTHQEGEIVSVPVPQPAAGLVFVSWGGDASGTSNPVVVTLDKDKTLIASYRSSGGGGLIPTGMCGTSLVSAMLAVAIGLVLMRGLVSIGHRRRRW